MPIFSVIITAKSNSSTANTIGGQYENIQLFPIEIT